MRSRHIRMIDMVLAFGTIIFLAGFVNYAQPLIIAPLDKMETTNGAVLFEFERGNVILIDDNLEFSSPQRIEAEDNLIINLKEGKYYWKVEGPLSIGIVKKGEIGWKAESSVREFTIVSEVNLKLKEVGEKYELVNAGNVELDVEIYNESKLIDNVILDIDESKDVSGTKFVGRQSHRDDPIFGGGPNE